MKDIERGHSRSRSRSRSSSSSDSTFEKVEHLRHEEDELSVKEKKLNLQKT